MIVGRAVAGFGVGILFGAGLAISQMVNPEKVLAFLNLLGQRDASLLLVMGAASSVAFVGYRLMTNDAPLFETRYYLPTSKVIDVRLIAGAAIFGIGWGLAGYCPGPAIAGLASGSAEPVLFVVAMIIGSQIARVVQSAGDSKNSLA